MLTERVDYPLSTWLIDLMNIISLRDFIEKKDALLLITEDIIEFLDMYSEGLSPMAAYLEMID